MRMRFVAEPSTPTVLVGAATVLVCAPRIVMPAARVVGDDVVLDLGLRQARRGRGRPEEVG
jgi:hypothetical protein